MKFIPSDLCVLREKLLPYPNGRILELDEERIKF